MKLSDLDFSAIGDMMRNLSGEEKEQLNTMAEDMMQRMTSAVQNQPEPEPEVDYMEGLQLDESLYGDMPGAALNQLEAAWDLEDFYDQDPDTDYSASVLFYSKALLTMLREVLYPVFRETLESMKNETHPLTKPVSMTSVGDYMAVLFIPGLIEKLSENQQADPALWNDLKTWLVSMQTILARAEYDTVSLDELQALKHMMLGEDILPQIWNLKEIHVEERQQPEDED